ncbi:putative flavin-nucleotide-binding protein [Desulfosporosinus orientis DSM 765]|uniref:Putative flavin-nucleotide-binding protein n=1 Tax=Desulfosporosinus orientis (strain ATCC 19365 / DSM 765 / NCIMB 8382 / VKM B-1628 / Singapore I) TaxID=768706 RepID=G7W7Y6_DESOD|nr:pyridoxamine 5'-phosphate oxidase family protein [Desulfosporosinus orientis]AET66412.1 putative flavin-nucleotide-binding protein [Desulfosporosinus orientis DSM 765]
MRRSEKEIKDPLILDEIMKKAQVCRLAVSYQDMPYIIPMNFGYADRVLYFHSAQEGLKLLILQENPQACFEVEINTQLVTSKQACNWSMRYQSVVGFGEVEFINDLAAKREAMGIIMKQYSNDLPLPTDNALAGVTLFKLNVNTMTGKQSQ